MPGSPSGQSPDRPPRTPNGKRKPSGASTPLQTISESQLPLPPPIPARSTLRNNSSSDLLPQIPLQPPNTSWFDSRDTSTETRRTAPPAYEWVPAPGPADTEYLDNGPVEGEKLAALRGAGGFRRKHQRSLLKIGLVATALLIIGLAVGLGVGLTVGRNNSNSNSIGSSPAGSDNSTTVQPFPLGQHSIVTALRTVTTNCTSNAATWRCFPYSIYDASDSGSALSSRSTFSWTITNTSSVYATNTTGSTPEEGVPANLTVSATDNPLGITFNATNLTYISTSSNSSSPRYIFSFNLPVGVFPLTTITTDNTAAKCFYNQTVFSGTLYLSAARTYPNGTDTDSKDPSQWPYAVEVAETSPGGADVPACYEYVNGTVGARITNFITPLTAEPESSQCTCDYRNY